MTPSFIVTKTRRSSASPPAGDISQVTWYNHSPSKRRTSDAVTGGAAVLAGAWGGRGGRAPPFVPPPGGAKKNLPSNREIHNQGCRPPPVARFTSNPPPVQTSEKPG